MSILSAIAVIALLVLLGLAILATFAGSIAATLPDAPVQRAGVAVAAGGIAAFIAIVTALAEVMR